MERLNTKIEAVETIAKVGHFVVERLRGGAWAELAHSVSTESSN